MLQSEIFNSVSLELMGHTHKSQLKIMKNQSEIVLMFFLHAEEDPHFVLNAETL